MSYEVFVKTFGGYFIANPKADEELKALYKKLTGNDAGTIPAKAAKGKL